MVQSAGAMVGWSTNTLGCSPGSDAITQIASPRLDKAQKPAQFVENSCKPMRHSRLHGAEFIHLFIYDHICEKPPV
jgi:hypothetical protein